MQKKISPIWFLKEPIDQEHKEYVLLDYLKTLSKDLDSESCFSVIKIISKMVRVLNDYRSTKKLDTTVLNSEDLEYIESFKYEDISDDTKILIDSIVDSSLETLYEYSEVCMDLLNDEISKIKIFKVDHTDLTNKISENSGIVIIRNMITDKMINYFFKTGVKMETQDGNKSVSILKKINIQNPLFSISYDYIYSEITREIEPALKYAPSFYVVEIYENFDEDSEIYKVAKEKFMLYVGI